MSEHVRGGKRERKRRGRGCVRGEGGEWGGGVERQKDRVSEREREEGGREGKEGGRGS